MRQNRCEERKETERLIKRLVYYPDLTTPPAANSISVSEVFLLFQASETYAKISESVLRKGKKYGILYSSIKAS